MGFGFENIFLTAAGPLHNRFFGKVFDTVNEKILQTLFLVRAGTPVSQALSLVKADLVSTSSSEWYKNVRQSLAKSPEHAEVFLDIKKKLRENVKDAVTPRVVDGKQKGFSAMAEMRAATVVAFLEVLNLYKIWNYETPKDPALRAKLQLQIGASMLSIAAVTNDILANALKAIEGDKYLPYQKAKLISGRLSAAASFVGAALNVYDALIEQKEGNFGLAGLHYFRAATQSLGGFFTLMSSLSYTQELFASVTESRGLLSVVMKLQGVRDPIVNDQRARALRAERLATRANWAFRARAGLMLGGLVSSVITLVITGAIWYFTDDELEDWCDACAFAKKPKNPYWYVSQKQEGLYLALYRLEFIDKNGDSVVAI